LQPFEPPYESEQDPLGFAPRVCCKTYIAT
jgi:hypothetical protein